MATTTAPITVDPGEDHDPDACSRAWAVLRTAHAQISECLGSALARECGLGLSDFEVLLALRDAGAARRRIGDLGDAVALSQSALSRLVDRLEHQGLVVRSKTDDDHRAVLVSLTDEGSEMLRKAVPLHAACVRDHLLNLLTEEEQATLVGILGRIR
mgnify:CR=1 FL=1